MKTFFVCLCAAAALAVNGCEPLDSGSEGGQQESQSADTTQQAADTAAQAQQPAQPALTARIDSLGGALSETNDRVKKVQEELAAVKDLLAAQPPAEVQDPEQQYRSGLDLFFNYKYQQSAETFRRLLDAGKPEELQSNCQYWIGECEYGMRRYNQAIESFEHVFRYRSSTKFDAAQIMIGESYLRLGDTTRARNAFNTLIRKYPDSEYAPRARKILARI